MKKKIKRSKEMKLGIAYNIFNGDELLTDSLKRLRTVSDYIVLTYQNTSNTGNISGKNLLEVLTNICLLYTSDAADD